MERRSSGLSKYSVLATTLVAVAVVLLAGGWFLERADEVDEANARLDRWKRESAEQAARFARANASWQKQRHELEQRVHQLEGKAGTKGAIARSDPAKPAGDSSAVAMELAALGEEIEQLRSELESLRRECERRSFSELAPPSVEDGTPRIFSPTITGPALAGSSLPPTPGRGSNAGAVNWSADQASGVPDTSEAGDHPTAWASREPDAGEEWLEVSFADWVAAEEIVVAESYNPGAVVRIEALAADDRYHKIWSGDDPTATAPGELKVPVRSALEIGAVRVTLDTSRVPGWNEIDAIGAVVDGETVWGASSEASSSYSDTYPALANQEDR